MTAQRLNPKLLEHLVDTFADDGNRAVDFLRLTESLLLMPDDALPGHAELIAYSLREAMKAIPASQRTGGGGEWSVRSRHFRDSGTNYKHKIVDVALVETMRDGERLALKLGSSIRFAPLVIVVRSNLSHDDVTQLSGLPEDLAAFAAPWTTDGGMTHT